MNILQNNPYRLLGVYSNSPTKERLANHNRMKAFLKVGKPVSFPLDLPQCLSSINRTEVSVTDADAKLTLPKDQILYAQFWFVKMTPLDDVAFNHLIAGEIDKAEDIWRKRECASSLQNLIVCALMCGKYAGAISLAETLYSTQYINQLVAAVVGMGGSFNVSDLTFSFIDVLRDEIGVNKLLSFITNTTWKDYIKDKAVKPIISYIQDAIDVAYKSKGKGATARLEAGRTLMRSTKDMLSDLRRLLSVSDIQYEVMADKLAQEILQCGIDYYNNTNDDDAPHNAMILQKYALSVAVGNLVKNRCKENVDTLEKVGPEYAVRNEIKFLMNIIKQLRGEGGHDKYSRIMFKFGRSISDVQGLVEKSIPYINRMKEKLGSSDDLYIKVTSAVVSSAVNAIVEIINMKQELAIGNANELKPIISAAISAMGIIGNIDVDTMTRQYYNSNSSTLISMNRRLNPSDDGACYIATMAYGDYEHPQVQILRHFRDLYLAQRNWGKWFINTYYKYSPKLVEKLKNHTLINKFIRKSLDGFISCIKNKYK